MKPNAPGLWYSRDGREVYVFDDGSFRCDTMRPDRGYFMTSDLDDLKGDDWLPAIAPEFPPLPPKPKLCFVSRENVTEGEGEWRVVFPDGVHGYTLKPRKGDSSLGKYCVVPHPDNDPEAVAFIEAAKK